MVELPLPTPIHDLTPVEQQRVIGAFLGAAVGDALGAPFEFGPPGQYGERFPAPVLGGRGELIGGGAFGWAPGEFTDDTQMSIALAESLLACGGFDPDDVWDRFLAWRRAAADCGVLTASALRGPSREGAALLAHEATGGRSAANGALMRVAGLACAYVIGDESALIDAARAQAALTHADPAAGWGAAIAAALVRRAVLGEDPIDALPAVLELVESAERVRFAAMLDPRWAPDDPEAPSDGTVWACLARAIWALRTSDSFASAVVAAIELGGDTDTVAAVTGALAGARHSVQGIPSRWLTHVHGTVGTPDGERRYTNADLQDLARRLMGRTPLAPTTAEVPAGPTEVAPGLHAADLGGAATVPTDWAVVSLCRTHGCFDHHPTRREVFLIDQAGEANADLLAAVTDAVDSVDAFLAEGRTVVVHCHGGRSRTGLVLKAWAMRNLGLDERGAHAWLETRWSRYHDQQVAFVELLRTRW